MIRYQRQGIFAEPDELRELADRRAQFDWFDTGGKAS